MSMRRLASAAALLAVCCATSALAETTPIYSGEIYGAYNASFCPALVQGLAKTQNNGRCVASAGTMENINKVSSTPGSLGLGQLDVVLAKGGDKVKIVRTDLANECLFTVTNNPRIFDLDDVKPGVQVVLPPKESGSAATFSLLQAQDPTGLGKITDITFATSVDDMLQRVLSADNSIGFFVQFPDPTNLRFRTVAEKRGWFVPAVNQRILTAYSPNDAYRRIYVPVETKVRGMSVTYPQGGPITTACTPMVVFASTDTPPALLKAVTDISRDEIIPRDFTDRAKDTAQQLATKGSELATQGSEKAVQGWNWLSEKVNVLSHVAIQKLSEAADSARAQMKNRPDQVPPTKSPAQ